jgi:DNA-binding MarR family transcriptional regulator
MKTGHSSRTAEPNAADRELAIRLGSLFIQVMSADGGAAFRVIDESGLSFSQFKTLIELGGGEGGEHSTVKRVAEVLGISVPSASRAVDDLVKRGFATRAEDPEDRRVKRVSLTDSGRELADRVVSARVSGLEAFVAGLTAGERRKLEAALEELLKRDEIQERYRTYGRRINA